MARTSRIPSSQPAQCTPGSVSMGCDRAFKTLKHVQDIGINVTSISTIQSSNFDTSMLAKDMTGIKWSMAEEIIDATQQQ